MTHCTCDRDTGPRDEPCPLHPPSLEDPVKAHIRPRTRAHRQREDPWEAFVNEDPERNRAITRITDYAQHEVVGRADLERAIAQAIHDARCGCGQGDEKGIDFYRDHAHLALNAIEDEGYVVHPYGEVADIEVIVRAFHDTYERLAPTFGYRTRESSAVPWDDVPAANKALMRATVDHLLLADVIRVGAAEGDAANNIILAEQT